MGRTARRRRRFALGALTLAAAVSAATAARAADTPGAGAKPGGDAKPGAGAKPGGKPSPRAEKKACVEAHAEGQSLLREGKLSAAREAIITCGREVCPGAIRKECAELLTDLEARQPSVVIEARDEQGRPTTEMKVSIDGEEVADSITGRAIEVDPGMRSFRFTSKRGKTLDQQVLILEGQKNRVLSAVFGHPPPPPPPPRPFEIPMISYVLAGVGAGALGNFVFWGLLGKAKQGELEDTCAPRCAQDDADLMRRHYLIADLSLGMAALGLGAAAVLVVTHNSGPFGAPPQAAPVSLVIGPGGVAAIGRF